MAQALRYPRDLPRDPAPVTGSRAPAPSAMRAGTTPATGQARALADTSAAGLLPGGLEVVAGWLTHRWGPGDSYRYSYPATVSLRSVSPAAAPGPATFSILLGPQVVSDLGAGAVTLNGAPSSITVRRLERSVGAALITRWVADRALAVGDVLDVTFTATLRTPAGPSPRSSTPRSRPPRRPPPPTPAAATRVAAWPPDATRCGSSTRWSASRAETRRGVLTGDPRAAPTLHAYPHEVIHLSPELLAYGIGPAVVVLAWLLTWAVLRRIPGWFFAAALVASLAAVLSPFASPRSGPIANGTELVGLQAFANGATALVTCLVLLVVTGVLRLVLEPTTPPTPRPAGLAGAGQTHRGLESGLPHPLPGRRSGSSDG